MSIPSNFTIEEVIKYKLPRELSEIVESSLAPFLEKVAKVEGELQQSYIDYELLEESNYFKQELCKQTGSSRELVATINLAFENSYVER